MIFSPATGYFIFIGLSFPLEISYKKKSLPSEEPFETIAGTQKWPLASVLIANISNATSITKMEFVQPSITIQPVEQKNTNCETRKVIEESNGALCFY